jgi:hypothetical protein
MPWTPANQLEAQQKAASFASEYNDALAAWLNALRSGANAVAAKGRVVDVVTRWQKSVSDLEHQSDMLMSNDSAMDSLGQLATQLAEEKATLAKLRGEAVTRGNQADSVNPKAKPSPYTNILGLRRMFRDSTRTSILIASIVFGVLALGAIGFVGYRSISSPAAATAPTIGGGGHEATRERNRRQS